MPTHRRARRMGGRGWILVALGGVCLALTAGPVLAQAQSEGAGRLVLSVLDETGAPIPDVAVQVTRLDRGEATTVSVAGHVSEVIAIDLPAGRYRIRAAAAGFGETTLTRTVSASRISRVTIRLSLAHLEETVIVSRDRQTTALDPRGVSTFLSREQIDALPEDPDELVRVLRDLSPPGAVIRIDGFTGGPMPPKAQILSIRIPRLDVLPAQEHGGLSGGPAIEIVTRPGAGDVHGTVDLAGRPGPFTARSPLAGSAPPAGTTTAGFTIDGPIVQEKVSFALNGRLAARSDTATVQAVRPDGTAHGSSIRQPGSTWLVAGRFATVLPGEHTLRLAVSGERRSTSRLGVGGYNLEDRAFDTSAIDSMVRLSTGGPWGRRRYIESRVQWRWSGTRGLSAIEAPTVQVLGAFTSGGAQVTGGARALEIQAASDLDYAAGAHAWRTGVLLDAGAYRVNRRSNYLGTYTFASLTDYHASRPAFYTIRLGDARLAYRDVQAAAYLQDDYRVRRSLLLSYGVRGEWQNMTGRAVDVLPRASVTWSPGSGTPVIRFSWGRFREWLPASVYEQTLLLDGERQVDVRVSEPSIPVAPVPEGEARRERVSLDDDARPATAQRLSIGVEHQFTPAARVSASMAMTRGRHLLRGRNLNPVTGGMRADAQWGNVIETVSDAASRADTLTLQAVLAPRSRRIDASVAYLVMHARSNTGGPFAVPSGNGSLDDEWGPTGPSHALTASIGLRANAFTFTLTPRWRSGSPYTITAPHSDDGLYTARPPGISRNSATTPAHWEIGVRVAYTIGIGTTRIDGATPSRVTSTNADGAAASAAPTGTPASGRRRLELFASVQNATNHPNYAVIGGVAGSPLFGQPLAAAAPRSIDVGVRLGF